MNLGQISRITLDVKEKLLKIKLFSYLPLHGNILNYRHWYGSGYLMNLYETRNRRLEMKKMENKRNEFLQSIEKAKIEWQFSLQLLTEITDTDLIDYASYLVKANEAHYRYLLKVARREKMSCDLWQRQKLHDI